MQERGRLFLGARQRRARRLLRRRVGWVVGFLALALTICLIALVVLVRKVNDWPVLPTSLLPPVEIEVTESGFRPEVIIVQPGSEVRWIVRDGPHTITDQEGGWDSGPLDGAVFLRTMPVSGESIQFLDYECSIHGRRASIHLLPAPIETSGGGI